jgi:tetratricopeptide (TPR) repeat protein
MKQPGDAAVILLHQALEVDSEGPNTLLACGNWFNDHQCWADAAETYGDYLQHRPSWYIEGRYVDALLRSDRVDEAIERLQHMRAIPMLADDSQASLTANLALAFLLKNDPGQALALASSASLQKRNLGEGLQQCLYLRAASRYLSGQKAKAIADLDRLYAVNASYPNLGEAKAEMQAGSYAVAPPKPYPDWYPHQLLEPEAEAPIAAADDIPGRVSQAPPT